MVDIGAFSIKCGIAGEASPRVAQPSLRILGAHSFDFEASTEVFGDEYKKFQYLWAPVFGYSCGKLVDKDVLEKVLYFSIARLSTTVWEPEERPVLVAEPVGATREFREWLISDIFEGLETQRCCIVPQPTLALLSTGRTTGFVIESGYRSTQFSPIYEGCALQPGSSIIDLGGYDVNCALYKLLSSQGSFHRDIAERTVGSVDFDRSLDTSKARVACVAKCPDDEPEKIEVQDTEDKAVTIGKERSQCTEFLFNPALADMKIDGIDKIAFDTIQSCDSDLHRDLWSNIVVSGGNTMIQGFCERLEDSLGHLRGSSEGIEVTCPEDRNNCVWRGGSALAQSPHFGQLCVTKADYDEYGTCRLASRFY